MTEGKDQLPKPSDVGRRAGLPASTSVVAEKTFTSPGGRAYRIIRTNERDPKDPEEPVPRKEAVKGRPTESFEKSRGDHRKC
jgi:hypothetical protein